MKVANCAILIGRNTAISAKDVWSAAIIRVSLFKFIKKREDDELWVPMERKGGETEQAVSATLNNS